jgi:hypothetical protein
MKFSLGMTGHFQSRTQMLLIVLLNPESWIITGLLKEPMIQKEAGNA